MPVPRRVALFAALAPALVLAACGGGGGAEPTATADETASRASATATPTLEPAGAVATPTPACLDPYPDGAPFTPEPDEPLRIQPSVRPAALARYTPVPLETDGELKDRVLDMLDDDASRVSIVVKDLESGRGFAHRVNERYYAASLFKTWVMLEAYHQQQAGLLDFAETYVVSDYYADVSLNAGELALCQSVALDEALRRMLSVSDNVAAHVLLDRTGAGNVNAAIAGLGLGSSAFTSDGSLPTTAADMALLLEAIASRRAVGPEASDAMIGLLSTEAIDDRLPARLPPGTRVAHKTGSWSSATHDAGVVFSPAGAYVIVVLTDFGFEPEARALIADISRAVYDHYN